MKKKYLIFVIMFMSWFSVLVLGHGLKIKIEQKHPCVLVTSMYHGDTVVRGAEVKIFFVEPGNESAAKREFQKGFTDQKGRFAFVPDKEGDYQFYTDDGMGHRKITIIKINSEFFKTTGNNLASGGQNPFEKGFWTPKTSDKALRAKTQGNSTDRDTPPASTQGDFFYCKMLLGLTLILASTFLFYFWKKRKENSVQDVK